MKTYRIEFSAVMDIEAEDEYEAVASVSDQYLLDSISVVEIEEM